MLKSLVIVYVLFYVVCFAITTYYLIARSEDVIRILGKTPIGRVTVKALSLDSDFDVLEARSYWVQSAWHPPRDQIKIAPNLESNNLELTHCQIASIMS